MKVSIVVPTVDGREHLLKRALEFVNMQTYKDREIIIIKEGLPAQEQREIGISKASGEYIALLDDDDFWIDKDYLKKMINKLETENLHMVSCGYYDERIKLNRIPYAKTYKDLLFSFSNLETSATVFRRDTYYEVGAMDRLFKTEHNHDLFYRIAKYGRFGIIKEVMVAKGYTPNHIGKSKIDKLQGYIHFHIKYARDILRLPPKQKFFVISKFFLVISTFGLLFSPRLYEVFRRLIK